MSLRPVTRRLDPGDLETARQVVSRAERKALERAEELRAEAEQLLKTVSAMRVDAEHEVRRELEAELKALRDEMDAAARRATVAENELDFLRVDHAELVGRARDAGLEVPAGSTEGAVPPLQIVDAGQDHPITEAAGVAAGRLHAQAELELTRARAEAVAILAEATRQAEELLATAVSAIERDSAIAAAARDQAERDGQAAADLRERAGAEAARLVDDARAEAERIIERARREAADAMMAARAQLVSEIAGLRHAVDRTRQSFETFLESQEPEVEPPVHGA